MRRAVGLLERQSTLASREVNETLENHESLKSVGVTVKRCVARPTGTVPTGIKAVVAAQWTPGVCPV